MPNWSEVLEELSATQKTNPKDFIDVVRRKYLAQVSDVTQRNVIAYYSAWLQKPKMANTSINDKDKSGLMLTIHRMERTKGLDIILHTPGGDLAATESLVDYLFSMFGKDIRVIVPQLSMSAGTMIALSSKEIIMGNHSNLGPIDPQMGGLPAQAILDEFDEAKADIKANPHSQVLWRTIVSKYNPTLLGACRQAIDWSQEMVAEWLKFNMCDGDDTRVQAILGVFSDHKVQKSHARHISKSECEKAGLNISTLENDQALQDAVLTTHHAFMHTFTHTNAVKIVENQMGVAYIEMHNPPMRPAKP